MALMERHTLAAPHYIVRRSRMGKFNFVLITDGGRLTGSVTISLEGQSNVELERQARDKIRTLAEAFAETTRLALNTETEAPTNNETG